MITYKGSTADEYAKSNGMDCIYIEYMASAEAYVSGSDIVISITYGEKVGKSTIVCGLYDSDERLARAVMFPVRTPTDTVYVAVPDKPEYKKLKVITFDSIDLLNPIKDLSKVEIR